MARNSIISKDQIIDKCFEIVDRDGYRSISARRLASELNVSHMTLFNYIRDMNELLNEVILRSLYILNSRILEGIECNYKTIKDKGIKYFCKIVAGETINFALSHRKIYLLIFDMDAENLEKQDELINSYRCISNKFEEIYNENYKKEYMIFVMTLNGTISSVLKNRLDYTKQQIEDFIDFSINKIY